jgi:hypothetical protein
MRTSFHHQSEAQPPNGRLTFDMSVSTTPGATALTRMPREHGARRLARSLSRPTVNNELSGALRLTCRIPVAFASRNDRALHQHMPGLCKLVGLAKIHIVGIKRPGLPG